MQNSENKGFMAYMKPLENVARASIGAVAIWNWMAEHDCADLTDAEAEKITVEIERRVCDIRGELYALALYQWADDHYSGKSADCEDMTDGE